MRKVLITKGTDAVRLDEETSEVSIRGVVLDHENNAIPNSEVAILINGKKVNNVITDDQGLLSVDQIVKNKPGSEIFIGLTDLVTSTKSKIKVLFEETENGKEYTKIDEIESELASFKKDIAGKVKEIEERVNENTQYIQKELGDALGKFGKDVATTLEKYCEIFNKHYAKYEEESKQLGEKMGNHDKSIEDSSKKLEQMIASHKEIIEKHRQTLQNTTYEYIKKMVEEVNLKIFAYNQKIDNKMSIYDTNKENKDTLEAYQRLRAVYNANKDFIGRYAGVKKQIEGLLAEQGNKDAINYIIKDMNQYFLDLYALDSIMTLEGPYLHNNESFNFLNPRITQVMTLQEIKGYTVAIDDVLQKEILRKRILLEKLKGPQNVNMRHQDIIHSFGEIKALDIIPGNIYQQDLINELRQLETLNINFNGYRSNKPLNPIDLTLFPYIKHLSIDGLPKETRIYLDKFTQLEELKIKHSEGIIKLNKDIIIDTLITDNNSLKALIFYNKDIAFNNVKSIGGSYYLYDTKEAKMAFPNANIIK